ncbi:hypothetical protein [Arcticibacter sp.]|uniref:hypothetical protein n=1 Tax=Arcticibacter sp. TaxID=1872630 RepID=UPI00388EDACD
MRIIPLLLFITLVSSFKVKAQTFSLPGDGRWYKVGTAAGTHGYLEYVYQHLTSNNGSLSSGELTFINYKDLLIQHHQTMGYQAWNQPQFAIINFSSSTELWVKAAPGVINGNFTIRYRQGATLSLGDVSDDNLYDNGGRVTIYEKLNDNANIFYHDLIVPVGNLSVGTTSSNGYKLNVNGTIHSKEVKVDVNFPAPDYVFDSNYSLMPLSELEQYIQANRHLPDVPPGNLMVKDGIGLSELNMKLLKKIEELTLYIINQEKKVVDDKEKIHSLEESVKHINRIISRTKHE